MGLHKRTRKKTYGDKTREELVALVIKMGRRMNLAQGLKKKDTNLPKGEKNGG